MSYAQARATVLAMLPKGGVGAEIGVWKGDFSRQILDAARPKTLHLIDPWKSRSEETHARAWYSSARGADMSAIFHSVQKRFSGEIETGQVILHAMTSSKALSRLPDGELDFVYVDGDHAYDAVRADLDVSFVKTRPGGLICVDDHFDGKWWGDSIIRAVNEFLGAHPTALQVHYAASGQVVILRK